MNEFDLRKFLYSNPLLTEEKKEVSDKARREAEEEGYEDGYDDAVEDAKKALDSIKDESEEEKDEKKEVKEVEEVTETPKLTKEGLRDMIKEKITAILNEEEITEQEDDEVDDVNIDIDKEEDIKVKDKETVNIDDESVESDIEVKTEVPGEDADTAAVLGLLTKAQDEAVAMGDEVLMDQIGNTITYFTRKHVVKA